MPADPERALDTLETEQINPSTTNLDRMTPLQIAQAMNTEDAKVAVAVAKELPQIARAIEAIADRLRRGGRLIYMGAGTSGRLGVMDAAECRPTFNTPPDMVIGYIAGGNGALTAAVEDVEDRDDIGRADVARLAVDARDVVVGITASGRTPYVLGALELARERGAVTVGIACTQGGPIEALSDISIAPVVGPEALTGSTRLKAGTAQKMTLNMLSTGAMVLLGKTYGNLMVDVVATNAKLRIRAVTIVQRATGADMASAEALLRQAGGETKVAIVAGRAGISPEQARQRLAEHAGSVRAALGEQS